MKKNFMLRILNLFVLMILLFSMTAFSFATSEDEITDITTLIGKTTLELVEDTMCEINLNDIGRFTKKITQFDSENKSATLTLTFTNLKKVEESKLPVEIFLVIDNSTSMLQSTSGSLTRKNSVINSANTLVDNLFAANENAKVGVVSFSSLDSVKGETEGTINDAKLLLTLNGSKTEVKNAISQIESSSTGPRTNIEAGITLASQNYTSSSTAKRYIVLLTDGVPNNALDGSFATYIGTVGARTKTKLQEIEQSGIDIIGAMIGLDGEKVETQSKKTYKALAEEVFGTVSNPTISKYYYISDNEIEKTIVNDIFQNIVSVKNYKLENIVIKDYFPQEIIDNFNFEYVASPNIGEVSQQIDKSDNSITWRISMLNEEETATLSYKLTLKDDYNKEIVDKILPTNEKVDITAEHDGINLESSSNESPKVRVLYIESVKPEEPDEPEQPEEPQPEAPNEIVIPSTNTDNTVAPIVIPQTGVNDTSLIFFLIVGTVTVVYGIKFYMLKKEISINKITK